MKPVVTALLLLFLGATWACGLAPVTPPPEQTKAAVSETPQPDATEISTLAPIATLGVPAIEEESAIANPTSTETRTRSTGPTPLPTPRTFTPVPPEEVPCAIDEAGLGDLYKGDALGRLSTYHPEVYCKVLEKPWYWDSDDDPHHVEPLVLRFLTTLAFRDPDAALQAIQLPFLDTIEWGDSDIVDFLVDLAWEDPEGLTWLLTQEAATGGDKEVHIPLVYLQSVNPNAAAKLANLDWVKDGLHLHEHQGLTLLQRLARVSNKALQHFLDSDFAWVPPQAGIDVSGLERLVEIAAIDEDAVIQIVGMPFMETIEFADHDVLARMRDLLASSPETLDRILANSAGDGGITNELSIYFLILDLEETAPEIAASINSLAWVQDGIKYIPPRNWGSIDPDPEEFERTLVLDMLRLADRGPDFLLELIRKPWMADELTGSEVQIFFDLQDIYYRHPVGAMRILRSPIMDSAGPEEERLADSLAELLRTQKDPDAFWETVLELVPEDPDQ